MILNQLSDSLKAKVAACETPEDIIALAKEEGYELSDEELDAIAGGTSAKGSHNWSKSCWGYCGDWSR